jgi:hypothetical protein
MVQLVTNGGKLVVLMPQLKILHFSTLTPMSKLTQHFLLQNVELYIITDIKKQGPQKYIVFVSLTYFFLPAH